MSRIVNGLSHQPWYFKRRLVCFPFNHVKVDDLILSATCIIEQYLPLKTMLFLSFQISHTVANQITWRIERLDLPAPSRKLNWLIKKSGCITTQNRRYTKPPENMVPNILQCEKRWEDVSTSPQPPTRDWASMSITWWRYWLSLVGSLSRNKRQTNNITFKGKSLCQGEATGTAISTVTH